MAEGGFLIHLGRPLAKLLVLVFLVSFGLQCTGKRPPAFTKKSPKQPTKHSEEAHPVDGKIIETDQSTDGSNLPADQPVTPSDRVQEPSDPIHWSEGFRLYQNNQPGFESYFHRVVSNSRGQSAYIARLAKQESNQQDSNSRSSFVVASVSENGRDWQPEVRVDRDPTMDSDQTLPIAIAMSQSGQTIVVWAQSIASNTSLMMAKFDRQANSWSDPLEVASHGGRHFSLAYDSIRDTFWLAYCHKEFLQQQTELRVLSMVASQNQFGEAQVVASQPEVSFSTPVLAFESGVGVLAYRKQSFFASASMTHEVLVRFLSNDQWLEPQTASQQGSYATDRQSDLALTNATNSLAIAVSPAQTSLIAWSMATKPENSEVWAAIFSPDLVKTSHQMLSVPGQFAKTPLARFNRKGDALVVWSRESTPHSDLVYGFYNQAKATFSQAEMVSRYSLHYQFAANLLDMPDQRFILAFVNLTDDVYRGQSAFFDPAVSRWDQAIGFSDPSFKADSNHPQLFHAKEKGIGVLWRQLFDQNNLKSRALMGALLAP